MNRIKEKYSIHLSLFRNLWKEPGSGITVFGSCLEFDPKSMFCFVCLFGFVVFEIDIKEKPKKIDLKE
jgi:hypothetical protein